MKNILCIVILMHMHCVIGLFRNMNGGVLVVYLVIVNILMMLLLQKLLGLVVN